MLFAHLRRHETQENALMAQRRARQNQKPNRRSAAPSEPTVRTREAPERKAVVVYGQPFTVLEDKDKNAFIFSGGQWVHYARSIKECQVDCQVKQLSQKINGMTRFEVCAPTESN